MTKKTDAIKDLFKPPIKDLQHALLLAAEIINTEANNLPDFEKEPQEYVKQFKSLMEKSHILEHIIKLMKALIQIE